jgi:hypothetical protein
MDRYATLLENYRNAWAGLRMIREAVEELGPVGVLPSPEAVIGKYGPEPIHEAQAIVDALRAFLDRPPANRRRQSQAMDNGGSHLARPAALWSALHRKVGAVERRRHRR